MKILNPTMKLWWLTLYLYLVPLLVSVLLVLKSGHLLGDFSFIAFDENPLRLLFTALVYLAPLSVIIFVINQRTPLETWLDYQGNSNYIFYLLLLTAVFTGVNGAIPVGAPPAPGISGVVQTIILKLNPYLLFILFSALRVSLWRIVVGGLCVFLMGLSQRSLLGYFVIAIGLLLYWINNKVRRRWQLLIVLIIPIVFTVYFQDLISHLYTIRNNSRGGAIEIADDMVISYAIGRINSFSSLYHILYVDCCGSSPDVFYTIAAFLERLTGLSIFGDKTPGQTYSEFLLGEHAGYGVFTSTAGAAIISFMSGGLLISAINVTTLLAMLRIMYLLLPTFTGAEKLPIFLIVLYLPYLSGDVWELSLLFQSIVIHRLFHWVIRSFGHAFNIGVSHGKLVRTNYMPPGGGRSNKDRSVPYS